MEDIENKKVCILTSVHPVFDTRIFYKEAKTLVKAGYDVTLIAQQDKNETIGGIEIIVLPKTKNRFFRFFVLDKKIYKMALTQRAEIYHFHDPELLPWMFFLKKKTGAKIIYDVHEDFPQVILSREWIPVMFRRPLSIFFNWFEKLISKNFDYIITATPYIKDNFKNHRVVNIGVNYPDLELFQTSNKFLLKNKTEYTLVYIGGLEKVRGIKEIIKTLSLINSKYNIKLKLFGKFSEKDFENELRNSKGWKKVEYFGWIPPKEVYQELIKADVGLICLYPLKRFYVSLPLKLFEYMAAGLPVVASNFPLWRKIIEENNCGICVNPLEPKEIAEAIEYLIEHPGEVKKMGENGKKAVLEKYNWGKESKKLLKIYEELFSR